MARNNTQRFEPTVTLNSKGAENALDALRVKAKQVQEAIIAAGKIGDEKKLKDLDRELKSINSTVRQLKQQTYDYNNVLKNINTSSINTLEKAAKALKNELRQLTPGTQEFINKSKQLDQVRGRLDQLNGRVRETHSWFSRAGNTFNKYFGIATAAIASVTGISFALRGASQEAAKMDDIYSDVMKTTGLLRKEVVWLNDEFKKLNTRTSREELNALARDAGKLGISSKEDVLEFVRAANQINVALSEDLGEGAIRNIGKLAEVFKLTDLLGIEKSLLSIGSAINALGQASTADEAFLVDFTQRLAGIAYQAGISIQNILGFASALDQTGQKTEMSATAFQKLIMQMFTDTAKFAQMANMKVEDLSELLRTDANQAIITVLKSLNDKKGLAQLAPIFDQLGLDGARAASVVAALATNINLVTEAQSLSNKEFALATSLTQEYNTKNENMQAQLDKAKKKFKDQVIELGEKLSPAFLKSTNASTLFLKAMMSINKEFIYSALVFAATIVVFKSWNIVMGISNTIVAAAKLVSLGYSWALASIQGNAIRAAAAVKLLNVTLSASAIGAVVTAVLALGYGLYKLITYQSELTKASKEYFTETEKLKREANDLLSIVEKSSKGSEEYKQAIAKLTEQYGPYINHLIDENGYLLDIKEAREKINTEIEKSIALKLRDQLVTDIVEKGLKKQAKSYEDLVTHLMRVGKQSEVAARIQATSIVTMIKSGMDNFDILMDRYERGYPQIGITWIQKLRDQNNEMINDIAAANNKFAGILAAAEPFGPKKPTGVETAAQRKARIEKEKKDAEDAAAERNRLLQEAADKRQKIVEEQFKKELAALEIEERKKGVLLKKQFMESSMSQQEYEDKSLNNTIEFLQLRNAVYLKYNQDNSSIEDSYYDNLMKLANNAIKKVKEVADISKRWQDSINKKEEAPVEDDAEMTKFLKESSEKRQSLESLAASIRENFLKSTSKKRYKLEMEALDKLLKDKLISEEQYEFAVRKLKLDKAQELTQQINGFVQAAADFVNYMQEKEYARLDRAKERELALYGDNADARAEIENKYEKKKFELQQKYADLDMGMKIAQAISAGAVAIATALSQLGTFAAPAIAFIAATTALQVATIVAQRNAIKSNTGSSSSGGTMNVNGYSEGGFTSQARSDKKAVGIVHANEWVAPAAMVRSNPHIFATLERQRVQRYSVQSPPKYFASGGFTSDSNSSRTDQLLAVLIQEVRNLRDHSLPAHVVLDQVNAQQEIRNKFKTAGSL